MYANVRTLNRNKQYKRCSNSAKEQPKQAKQNYRWRYYSPRLKKNMLKFTVIITVEHYSKKTSRTMEQKRIK